MDLPSELVAARLKVGGLALAAVSTWILGGALPVSKSFRTASLTTSVICSIAGVISTRKLILLESFYQARLEMSKESFQTELAHQTTALEQELERLYLPSEPVNVIEPEPLNLPSSKEVQRSEPAVNVREPPSEPPSEPDVIDPLKSGISGDERGLTINMKRAGLSQDEIILRIWGAKKGGSERYIVARTKYRQILTDAGME